MNEWDWEEEHGDDFEESSDEGHDSSHDHEFVPRIVYPPMGDPLCTEYERLVSAGSMLLKSADQDVVFKQELMDTWRKWRKRVDTLCERGAFKDLDHGLGDL